MNRVIVKYNLFFYFLYYYFVPGKEKEWNRIRHNQNNCDYIKLKKSLSYDKINYNNGKYSIKWLQFLLGIM